MCHHVEAVVVFLEFDGVGVIRVVVEKVVAELIAGFQDFGEARVVFDIGINGEVKKL